MVISFINLNNSEKNVAGNDIRLGSGLAARQNTARRFDHGEGPLCPTQRACRRSARRVSRQRPAFDWSERHPAEPTITQSEDRAVPQKPKSLHALDAHDRSTLDEHLIAKHVPINNHAGAFDGGNRDDLGIGRLPQLTVREAKNCP